MAGDEPLWDAGGRKMGEDMSGPRCIFCGCGAVPLTIGGEIEAWGCMYCRSKRVGRFVVEKETFGNFETGQVVDEYVEARAWPSGNSKVRWCPSGTLFVVDWERVC